MYTLGYNSCNYDYISTYNWNCAPKYPLSIGSSKQSRIVVSPWFGGSNIPPGILRSCILAVSNLAMDLQHVCLTENTRIQYYRIWSYAIYVWIMYKLCMYNNIYVYKLCDMHIYIYILYIYAYIYIYYIVYMYIYIYVYIYIYIYCVYMLCIYIVYIYIYIHCIYIYIYIVYICIYIYCI